MNQKTSISKKQFSLEEECDFFHKSLFRKKAPTELQILYKKAHLQYLEARSFEKNDLIKQIIFYDLDVFSIELALRSKHPDNILQKKLHILLYLVEAKSAYFHSFHNLHPNFLKAFLELSFGTVRSILKKIKGLYLIWRYQLV